MSQPTPSSFPAARRIALAAALIAAGNVASRLLGLLREAVIARTFGRNVDTFTASSAIPTIIYDLLVNGAISAALVPVLSEYAEGDQDDFWHIASTIINLTLLVVALVVGLLIWQAQPAIALLAGGFGPGIRSEATRMVRLQLPAVLFMALAGLITALLYARQRFLLPAFTTSAFNAGIILGALLLATTLGPFSLVAGVLLGAALQVLLQLPGLRGMRYRPILDLRHPGVRKILRLYAPVALGIGFSVAGIVLDRNLASRVGDNALTVMRYATTLIQFPLGLVATAVSFAVLPTLARQASAGNDAGFQQTLAMGIKVVLLLIIPATLGLAALAEPITALLFERGRFSAADTAAVAQALRLYLPGLPAAALDQMLLFAFYAHKRTLAPNLVQGAAVLIYAITALGLLAWNLGVGALILGNSAQWVGHLLILLVLARGLVSLRGVRLGEAALKSLVAGLLMAAAAWWLAGMLRETSPPWLVLVLAGGSGAALYLALCLLLRVEALGFFVGAVHRRLAARRAADRVV